MQMYTHIYLHTHILIYFDKRGARDRRVDRVLALEAGVAAALAEDEDLLRKYMHIYIYVYAYIYIYMYMHIYVYIHTYMYMYLSLSLYIYIYVYTCTDVLSG